MKLYIIGVGPGGKRHLTADARERIEGAELVLATGRLYTFFAKLNRNMRECGLGDIEAAVRGAAALKNVAVLVSGDSGFFSLGKSLPEKLEGIPGLEIVHLPGLSSLQYLAAKSGLNYEDAKIISLHGRRGSILPYVSYNHKVFALTGGEIKAQDVISELVQAGIGGLRVIIGQNLGGTGAEAAGSVNPAWDDATQSPAVGITDEPEGKELILDATAQELTGREFSDLACLFVFNDNFTNPQSHIPDSAFIRGKTSQKTIPMTKQTVRTLGIAALNIQPGDTVFDIGAGTGSVAVEVSHKAQAGMVYALERNSAALELLAQNREKFGAFNLRIVAAEAPAGLAELPAPDKVFIGGSGGKLSEIMRLVRQKNAAVRLVVTAITLETLNEAVRLFKEHGLEAEISCINASIAHKVGGYCMMKAENPVYIISGGGHAD